MAKTKAQMEGRIIEEPAEDKEIVWVEVTEEGDGQISTGVHSSATGDELFEEGDTFATQRVIAQALRKRHYVQILKEPPEQKRGPGRPPKVQD